MLHAGATLAALVCAAPAPLLAHDYTLCDLKIGHPYARVTIPGRPAAGYMSVRNTGGEADAIVSASSPLAERIELYTHLMVGSVMKMRRLISPEKAMCFPSHRETAAPFDILSARVR